MDTRINEAYDVIVIGARIAGSTFAALLGDVGYRVLLVDKASFPSPTVSTHFFRGQYMLAAMQRIGVLDDVLAIGSPKLVCQYVYRDGAEEPYPHPPQFPGDVGYSLSVRREPLDHLLVQRACRNDNVHLLEKTTLTDLLWGDGRVVGARLKTRSAKHTVRARLVVGADGRDSVVARLVNPAKEDGVPGFRAMYYHYIQDYPSPTGKPPDGPEFSFIGDEIAYVFPNDNGISCIALSVTLGYYEAFRADYETQFRQHITQHRGIGRRWITATRMGKMFSHAPRENYVRLPYGQGWALLGDAGQYQDPWSGFGMDSASTAACLLADAVLDWLAGKQSEADALAEFHRRRNEICVPLFNETVEEGRGLSSNGA